jgi:hypothetical protein
VRIILSFPNLTIFSLLQKYESIRFLPFEKRLCKLVKEIQLFCRPCKIWTRDFEIFSGRRNIFNLSSFTVKIQSNEVVEFWVVAFESVFVQIKS